MTRKVLIDQIRRLIYGGFPPDGAEITRNLVNTYIDEGIALAAKQNFKENFSVSGDMDIAGSFYVRFQPKNVTRNSDTGYYEFIMPAMPFSFIENKQSVFVVMPSKVKIFCDPIKEIEASFMHDLPFDSTQIYYWHDSTKGYLWSKDDITEANIYLNMPTSSSGSMDDEINCPADLVPVVMDFVIKLLSEQNQLPETTHNENIETKNVSK